MDAQSGIISVSGDVDFSTSDEIQLVVLASDAGQSALTTSTTVIIRAAELNQHSPVIHVQSLDEDSDPSHLTVAENSPEDTFIAHVFASDLDFGSSGLVECSLLADDDDDARNFHLVALLPGTTSSSYRAAEYKLLTSVSFDRENRSVYEISLECRDFGEPARRVRRRLVVEVTDVDDNLPVFDNTSYHFTVPENNRRGQVIGQVSASDSDNALNASVLYFLASDDDSSAWFNVDPSSGVITAKVSFDREFVDHFHFVVFASSRSISSISISSSSINSRSQVIEKQRFLYHFNVEILSLYTTLQ